MDHVLLVVIGLIALALVFDYINGFHDAANSIATVVSNIAIGLGTLSGGWPIVKTMGTKITKLTPGGGFAAETGAASAILIATVMGSASARLTPSPSPSWAWAPLDACRPSAGGAGRIVWAWILTIPAAGAVGAMTYWTLFLLGAG